MAYKIGKYIYLDSSHQYPVGRIENNEYHSTRSAKKHFFKSQPGWAISVEILDFLAKKDIDTVILEVIATSGSYDTKAKLSDFTIHGKELNYGDKQLLLLDKYWSQQKPTQLELGVKG